MMSQRQLKFLIGSGLLRRYGCLLVSPSLARSTRGMITTIKP
jgi:hypothetical protein